MEAEHLQLKKERMEKRRQKELKMSLVRVQQF